MFSYVLWTFVRNRTNRSGVIRSCNAMMVFSNFSCASPHTPVCSDGVGRGMIQQEYIIPLRMDGYVEIIDFCPRGDDEIFDLTRIGTLQYPKVSVFAPRTSPRVRHDLQNTNVSYISLIYYILTLLFTTYIILYIIYIYLYLYLRNSVVQWSHNWPRLAQSSVRTQLSAKNILQNEFSSLFPCTRSDRSTLFPTGFTPLGVKSTLIKILFLKKMSTSAFYSSKWQVIDDDQTVISMKRKQEKKCMFIFIYNNTVHTQFNTKLWI